MNNKGNNNIPTSKNDDDMLTTATKNVFESIREKYLCLIPDTWNFECGEKKLTFKDIKEKMISEGISPSKAESYYGGKSSIETDAHVIYLTMSVDGKIVRKPIFMGEMKKQGTNDRRLMEGKKRQAIGNAGTDRVAKNFEIASDYCFLCDKEFFPYNVFLHGCDFKESEITVTTKAKLHPFFGALNVLNPYFDKDVFWTRKGGSCFFQGEPYTYESLYKVCFECAEIGVKHYLKKYAEAV
jgi:type II restriction enzyme